MGWPVSPRLYLTPAEEQAESDEEDAYREAIIWLESEMEREVNGFVLALIDRCEEEGLTAPRDRLERAARLGLAEYARRNPTFAREGRR